VAFAGGFWCRMAVSVAGVYRLAVEELRVQCVERGLDSTGPVKVLRRRLVDHIRSSLMDGVQQQQQPVVQASVPTHLESNGAEGLSPIFMSSFPGNSGDSSMQVLIELLRQIPPLRSESPEDIMCLFVRLGEVYDLRIVDDRAFMLRIMPFLSGSLLKFLGDCLREGVSWIQCKSRLLEYYFPGFVKERLIRDLIVFNLQREDQPVRAYVDQIFQAAEFLCYAATEQQLVDRVVMNLHPWVLGQATLLDRPRSLSELRSLLVVIDERCAVARERQLVARGPPVDSSAGVGPGIHARGDSRRQGRFAGAPVICWGCGCPRHLWSSCPDKKRSSVRPARRN